MLKVKDVIKSPADIEQAIDALLPEVTQGVNDALGHLYPQYKRTLHNQLTVGIFLVVLFFGMIIVYALPETFPNPELIYAVSGFVFVVGLGVEVWHTKKRYNLILDFVRQFKSLTIPYLGRVFGADARLLYAGPHVQGYTTRNNNRVEEVKRVRELIAQSELITDAAARYHIGDIIEVTFNNRQIILTELREPVSITQKRGELDYSMYKGYFVSVDLEKPLQAKTFITTQVDEFGFGNRSRITEIMNTGPQETTLEWGAFERIFRVTSTDPVEARYILTPDFMEDLVSWWLEHIVLCRVSFINNRMSLLLPDTAVQLVSGYTLEPASIKRYLSRFGKPLMRTLHLIEDMRH